MWGIGLSSDTPNANNRYNESLGPSRKAGGRARLVRPRMMISARNSCQDAHCFIKRRYSEHPGRISKATLRIDTRANG